MTVLRSPRRPLLLACACLVGLAITGVLAYLVPITRAGDSVTLEGFSTLDRPRSAPLLGHIASLCDPDHYAVLSVALVLVALLRGRPRVAVLVCGLVFVTGWTTHSLKPLLAAPRGEGWFGAGQIASASWPSGHATAAMTLALCAVLVAPARLRPSVAVLGAAFSVAVGYAILALGWHFPSDVFGGYLVAATWTGFGVAGLLALEERHPSRVRAEARVRPADVLIPVAAVGAGLTAIALVVLAFPGRARDLAVAHTTFVVGAVGIATLAIVLALALARSVRGSEPLRTPPR